MHTGHWRMKARRRVPLLLAVTALIATWVATTAPAQAATTQTLTVRVGQDLSAGAKNRAADLMRFLPGQLLVHQGDSLKFVGSFHTATALPVGTPVNRWIAANTRPGRRYAFVAADEPGRFQLNPNVIYPSGCAPGNCRYDGHHLVNSGLLGVVVPSATMTVNARVGSVFWVICLVHPEMRLQVLVVPGRVRTPTQANLDAAARAATAYGSARATELWNALNAHPVSHLRSDGTRVWEAYAGYDVPGIQLLGMFPQTLRIHRGDLVRWHFTHLRFDPHSVVFPAPTADVISTGPPPQCERNSGGDVPANPNFTCPPGSHGPIEIELDTRLLVGGGASAVTTTSTYANSGARGAFVPNRSPYVLRFPVASPVGFAYACGVHGTMMSGVVMVS